jgi:predicted transcriptional regulator
MKRKRSRLETFYVLLTLCTRTMKKTHVMYQANLSHYQLEKYLKLLITKQLLMKKEDTYVTTDRGIQFINTFRELQVIMGENNMNNSLFPYARNRF